MDEDYTVYLISSLRNGGADAVATHLLREMAEVLTRILAERIDAELYIVEAHAPL